MSNPIPPFVCCTPPPIDCTVDAPPPVDDDFGDFAAVEDQFEVSSFPATPVHAAKLPDEKSDTVIHSSIPPSPDISSFPATPVHAAKLPDEKSDTVIHSSIPPSPDSGLNFIPEDDSESGTAVKSKSFEEDIPTVSSFPPASTRVDLKTDLPFVIEANSPPPLDFEPVDDDLTPCDDLDNDEEVDDFPVDDVGKYDDNISLPSLKFDLLSNVSKSTTPVSDELVKSSHEDSDSINTFQPIPSAVLELETNIESSTVSNSLSKETADIPLETVGTSKETSEDEDDCGNDLHVLEQSSKEFSANFTAFEAFPSAPYVSDLKPEDTEPPDDHCQTKETTQESSDFAFEADFSQFSSFEPAVVVPSPVTSQIVEKTELTKKSSLDDLEADDFDDFQDFAAATTIAEVQRQHSIEETPAQVTPTHEITESSNHNSDDDEFGEFSEVIESNATTTTHIPTSNSGINLANLNDKLKSILEMMFPFANVKEAEDGHSENDDSEELTSSITINQIDTAKALEYQWSNSEVRHSLIKSLGVDSRNILYGEKWNSSMPRYAANLSFNPLEPMKSDKASAGGSNASSSSSTTDFRKRSESLTSSASASGKADVPAAEFDWNSSGLVNPLDASQAHTLLLDLDQLVVVANLDKINLDSSCSSPCFATSSSSLISTVTTTSSDITTHSITVTQHDDRHTNLLTIDVQPQNVLLITMSSPLSSPTPSPSPVPSWSSSSLLLIPQTTCNPSVNVSGTCRTESFLNNNDKTTNDYVINDNCTTTTPTTTTTNIFANLGSNDHNFNQYLDCRVKEILHERTLETIHTPQLGESHSSVEQQSNSTLNSNDNIYDGDKQLRRFIDEEAISTTIESKSNADASAIIPTTTATAAAAAAITTTTPSVTAATTSTTLPDDYIDITCGGDFHSGILETNIDAVIADSPAHNHKTHTAKYQESSKTDLETELQHSGVVTTSTYAGPLKETHIFTPSKSDSTLVRSSSKTPRTSESKCPIDFDYEIAAAGIIIDEAVVKKEYRDLEYNPGFGLKYREETEYTQPETQRDTFGLNGPPTQSYLLGEQLNKMQISEKPSDLDEFSDFVSEKIPEVKPPMKAVVPNNNSFDDEFSDFQSVPPPPSTVVPSAIIPSSTAAETKTSPSHLRKVKEGERSSTGSRTGTPISLSDEMILSPAILLPQAIQMENKPKIEWPEPGINPEELARIEELFPQPKAGSNKPSPSHSGRSQNQQQQQNRGTPQSGTDDDDWSDFVSVPAAVNHIQSISQQFQKRHASPAKSASDPNEDEWSDFVSSAPPPAPVANHLRQLAAYPQFNSAAWQNANFYNNPLSAYASPPTSFYYQPPPPQQQQQQNLSNNLVPNLSNVNNNTATNNNIINNNSINQYLISNRANQSHHHHHHHQQHIQMMRDFSSMSPMDGGSHMATPSLHHQYAMQTTAGFGYAGNRGGIGNLPHHGKSSQFGGGSSKVAPSISLIPDLGFVAPTHTSFISVPKNSFISKK